MERRSFLQMCMAGCAGLLGLGARRMPKPEPDSIPATLGTTSTVEGELQDIGDEFDCLHVSGLNLMDYDRDRVSNWRHALPPDKPWIRQDKADAVRRQLYRTFRGADGVEVRETENGVTIKVQSPAAKEMQTRALLTRIRASIEDLPEPPTNR